MIVAWDWLHLGARSWLENCRLNVLYSDLAKKSFKKSSHHNVHVNKISSNQNIKDRLVFWVISFLNEKTNYWITHVDWWAYTQILSSYSFKVNKKRCFFKELECLQTFNMKILLAKCVLFTQLVAIIDVTHIPHLGTMHATKYTSIDSHERSKHNLSQ